MEDAGYIGSDDNAKVMSELMGEIQAVIVDRQVSSEAQTVLEI